MLGKIEGRRIRVRQRVRWLDGITDSMDMSLSKQVGDGQGSLMCYNPGDHKELDMTELKFNLCNVDLICLYIRKWLPP